MGGISPGMEEAMSASVTFQVVLNGAVLSGGSDLGWQSVHREVGSFVELQCELEHNQIFHIKTTPGDTEGSGLNAGSYNIHHREWRSHPVWNRAWQLAAKNLTKQVLRLKFKVLQRLASENDYVLACSRWDSCIICRHIPAVRAFSFFLIHCVTTQAELTATHSKC